MDSDECPLNTCDIDFNLGYLDQIHQMEHLILGLWQLSREEDSPVPMEIMANVSLGPNGVLLGTGKAIQLTIHGLSIDHEQPIEKVTELFVDGFVSLMHRILGAAVADVEAAHEEEDSRSNDLDLHAMNLQQFLKGNVN